MFDKGVQRRLSSIVSKWAVWRVLHVKLREPDNYTD